MGRSSGADEPIHVCPVGATYWTPAGDAALPAEFTYVDLADPAGVQALQENANDTVWLEANLAGLERATKEWFEGRYDVWETMQNPVVEWDEMEAALEALGLRAPATRASSSDTALDRLLRAIPYVYMRGSFGTIRDAFTEADATSDLTELAPDADRITAFPVVGFNPGERLQDGSSRTYVVIRTVVAAVQRVVITIRLPDTICAPGPDAEDGCVEAASARLVVPRRFLPMRGMPAPRELAEAIGIHQATTARAIPYRIRSHLAEDTAHAAKLRRPVPRGASKRSTRVGRSSTRKSSRRAERRTTAPMSPTRSIGTSP